MISGMVGIMQAKRLNAVRATCRRPTLLQTSPAQVNHPSLRC